MIVPEGLGPVGPVSQAGCRSTTPSAAPPDVAAAYSNADVLLTLAAADPAPERRLPTHLGNRSVVLVTAGSSSAGKLHATAEMIRLAGLRIVSAVVLGADKTDDSTGTWAPPSRMRTANTRRTDGCAPLMPSSAR